MPKYIIFYKGGYYDFQDWFDETVTADTATAALRNFLRSRGIRKAAKLDGEYQWLENDWYMMYRGVDLLDEAARTECLQCHGAGSVPTRKPARPDAT